MNITKIRMNKPIYYFLQKTLLLESGIPVSVSDKEDFQLLVEVINAKAKEDREVSPREMLRRFRGQ